MLRLQIEQQWAKLGLNIKDPAISIRTKTARLKHHTEAAEVNIRQHRGVLEIDQYPCRASCGYRNAADFTRYFAQKGKAAVLEGIARVAAEGDRMAHVESGENVVVALAVESTQSKPLEVVLVPTAPPRIRYQRRLPEYQVRPGQFSAQYQPGSISVRLQRGTVEGYLAQRQYIRMWTTGSMDFSV